MPSKTAKTAVETVVEADGVGDTAQDNKKNIGGQKVADIQAIPLWLINSTYNTRTVFPVLKEMGYEYIQLIKMAVSDDLAEREQFCSLVEEHENVPHDGGNMTVIALANSIRKLGQLQIIRVQQLGTSDYKIDGEVVGKKYGYALVAGSHRTAAIAYNWAKHGHILPHPATAKQARPFVRAELIRADKRKAFDLSRDENLQRRMLSDFAVGEHVAFYKDEEGMSWDEIVESFGRSLTYLRGCYALYRPVEGVESQELMEKLSRKEVTKAEAIAEATGKPVPPSRAPKSSGIKIGDGAANSRGGPLNKVCSYGEVCRKIDETPHDGKPASVARIKAFAEVIGLSYEDAMVASEDRLKKRKAKTA